MESDLGKLFIGGISWDTDENKLKEYFGQYGEVMEVVIMRDRITGRARGFGFIVFADPAVAERVVMDKHMIDGRTVEAKKAVPRDDQQILSRKSNNNQGSPGIGRTKKIFVGGLASTVTESDFKKYFDQFGTIADVVVMYDHNTQRPRGFGFITYDSEDAVDRVLHRTFHELNGKMVEVKRAVPKELSPGPARSPLIGYNYNFNRASNLINNYPQGYNLNSIGGYNRVNPLITARAGLPPFGNLGRYGMDMNLEPGFDAGYALNSALNKNHSYDRGLGPYHNGHSNRYNMPIGYNGGNARGDLVVNSGARNVWGNGSISNPITPSSPGAFFGSGNGNFGVQFRDSGSNWGAPSLTPQVGDNSSAYNGANFSYGFGDGNHGSGGGSYGRPQVHEGVQEPLAVSSGSFDTSFGDLYRGGSAYRDSTWRSDSSELDGSGSFGFGLGTGAVDIASRPSDGFIGNYSVTNRQANRGIAA